MAQRIDVVGPRAAILRHFFDGIRFELRGRDAPANSSTIQFSTAVSCRSSSNEFAAPGHLRQIGATLRNRQIVADAVLEARNGRRRAGAVDQVTAHAVQNVVLPRHPPTQRRAAADSARDDGCECARSIRNS